MRQAVGCSVFFAGASILLLLVDSAGPPVVEPVPLTTRPPAPARAPEGPLVGELTLELDQPSFTQSDEISGRITFRVEWRDKTFGAGRTRVWLGTPQVGVMMDESVAIEAMTDTRIVDPVWIGHTYQFGFVLRALGPIQEYADSAGKALLLARTGRRRLKAWVSSYVGSWSNVTPPRQEVSQDFESVWASFMLTPGDGDVVEESDVLSWIKSPPPAHGNGWYYNDPRQALFAYYQFWDYPLRDLPLFLPPDGVTTLETCARPPCFLLLRPNQEYGIRFADQQPHSLFDDHALTSYGGGDHALQAPPREGLFAIQCTVHGHRVGWLLVVDELPAPRQGPDPDELR